MSKKKFTEGLENLFGEVPNDTDQKGNFLLFPVDKPEAQEKSPSKNFTSDLDSFLKEAFEEAFEDSQEKARKPKASKKSSKSLSGLDALIRSTIEPAPITFNRKDAKRITFLVDKEKLEKLKKIAKQEKAYIKDVISNIVEEYISNYKADNPEK